MRTYNGGALRKKNGLFLAPGAYMKEIVLKFAPGA
jgi:hypothetical protein